MLAQTKGLFKNLKNSIDGHQEFKTSIEDCISENNKLEYCKIVSDISHQLSKFYGLDESINPISNLENYEAFIFEVSGFLQEYGCPYSSLTDGDISQRLSNEGNRCKLLFFLLSELQAAKLHFSSSSAPLIHEKASQKEIHDGCKSFKELDLIRQSLKMDSPPANVSTQMYFNCLEQKLGSAVKKLTAENEDVLSKPIVSKQLDHVYWEKIKAINDVFTQQYSIRKSMLLKRLDVTIDSFGWSERAKTKYEEIAQNYQHKRQCMSSESSVSVAHLLAAREDLSQIYKTASGKTRHSCKINKVQMGAVPDRGGRCNEGDAPPPEMPSWKKRESGQGSNNYQGRSNYSNSHNGSNRSQNQNNQRPYSGSYRGNRGAGNNNRGNRGGQSRWSRGRGGERGGFGRGSGSFNQMFGQGGQQYGSGGFNTQRNFTS